MHNAFQETKLVLCPKIKEQLLKKLHIRKYRHWNFIHQYKNMRKMTEAQP